MSLISPCEHCPHVVFGSGASFGLGENISRLEVDELKIRVCELEAELARAKAVVQWVTYDWAPETLPEESRWVMVILAGHAEPVASLCLLHIDDHAIYWTSSDKDWAVSRGDRWAYLPVPD